MNSPDPVAESSPGSTSEPDDEIRDELPEDLQPEFAGAYQFPDNSRRRIPGFIYLTLAVGCFAWYATSADSSAIVKLAVREAESGCGGQRARLPGGPPR